MGYWSYGELRKYGAPKPAPKLPQIFAGKARDRMVDQVARLLDIWRYSPFEREGSIVAGMRSELCMAGYSWPRADQDARSIVVEALRRNGAARPSWAEGQIEHVIENEACKWCRGDLSELHQEGKKGARFCSTECARFFLRHRERNYDLEYDQTWGQARSFVYRSKVVDKVCLECAKRFKPVHDSKLGRYCSPRCYHESLRKMDSKFDLVCVECTSEFKAKARHAKFCGKDCEKIHDNRIRREARERARNRPPAVRVPRYPRSCPHCSTDFMAKSAQAIYCSAACSRNASYHRRRRESNVIYLTPAIFDRWFKRAA